MLNELLACHAGLKIKTDGDANALKCQKDRIYAQKLKQNLYLKININQTIVATKLFVNITLRMEVALNITSQSSIIIACFIHVAHILLKNI